MSGGPSANEIRAFIAVDLPKEIKMEIDKMIAGFRQTDAGIRWVKAANLHLTLRFLGNIPEQSIQPLAENIRGEVGGLGSFEMSLSGLGGFPNLRRPRVIWVGTGTGTEKLKELAVGVEKAAVESGFGIGDKPFSSHLTIGRVKYPKGLDRLLGQIEKTEYDSKPFDVGEVVVFRSDLSPAGPKYTKLEAVSL
jgi:2'-5' RNA ligase